MTSGDVSLLIGLSVNACAIVIGAWINGRRLGAVISDKADEAARLLLEHRGILVAGTTSTARLLAENNDKVRGVAGETKAALNQIHVLVNSSLTEAKQEQLDANVTTLVLLQELLALKHKGKPAHADTLAQIKETKSKIAELRSVIEDRRRQTELAEAQKAEEIKIAAVVADTPVPIVHRTATATERVADATERVADATEKAKEQ